MPGVRHVDDNAQAVKLRHELAAEPAEPCIARLLASVRGRAAHVVGQLDNADSQPVVDLDQIRVVLERAGPLEVQHDGKLAVTLGRTDVCGVGGQAELVALSYHPEDLAEPVHRLPAALPGGNADHARAGAARSPGVEGLAPVFARAGAVDDDCVGMNRGAFCRQVRVSYCHVTSGECYV